MKAMNQDDVSGMMLLVLLLFSERLETEKSAGKTIDSYVICFRYMYHYVFPILISAVFSFGRMLSAYLGEDNMLAVVCKTLDAANCFEKYDTDGNVDVNFGIHQEAANLGVPIRRRFPIICLDSVR